MANPDTKVVIIERSDLEQGAVIDLPAIAAISRKTVVLTKGAQDFLRKLLEEVDANEKLPEGERKLDVHNRSDIIRIGELPYGRQYIQNLLTAAEEAV